MHVIHAALSLAFVTSLLAGCSRKEKPELPPATGTGAPALPALPKPTEPPPAVGATEDKTTGTLHPHEEVQLAPKAGGIIEKILVDEGDRVKKGDVVIRMDARDAALRLSQAKTSLRAARVQLDAVKLEHARSKALLDQNALPKAQWEQVDARYQGALVGVQQAEDAVAIASKAVADAIVRAPINGIVTAKLKSEGEMATTMPPTIVLVIQDQDTLDLRFRLPERALASLRAGDTFTAKFSSVGITRQAKITRINPTVDARSRTIEVVAELQNPELSLKPGLLAEIELGKLAASTAPATPQSGSASPPPSVGSGAAARIPTGGKP